MHKFRSSGARQWRFTAFFAAVLGLVATLLFLSGTVRHQLQNVVSAPHDNLQWSLGQLEVENARFSVAVLSAMQSTDGNLENLRRRFDIYFSRSEVIISMQSAEHLPANPKAIELTNTIYFSTQALASLVDTPDGVLRANLPMLLTATQTQLVTIQDLAVVAIEWFAAAADSRRMALSNMLFQTFFVAGLLACILVLAFFFLRRSIGDARSAQVELRNATTRLQSTIGASQDAVILTDKYGTLLDYNGAAVNVFGYAKAEIIGKNAIELLLDEKGRRYLKEGYDQLRATKEGPFAGENLLHMAAIRKGGEVIQIETSIAPVLDRDNQMIFISFVRDISERAAASENLRKSRDEALLAANAKSDFIAVMSHEMRTPLNGVVAAHEILAETDLSPHQIKFLNIARSSATHLLQHVNDVLDISSIDAGMPSKGVIFQPLSAIADVMESTQPLVRESGNTLRADFTGADNAFYYGEEAKFRRILLNLLGNAIKFTKSGLIQIDFGISARDDTTVLLELHVSDTGRGIPQNKLDDVFNAFVRLDASYDRDTDGTGLGLSITRRLVTSMGGEIGVDSEVGAGSTFWVKLPLDICEQPLKSGPQHSPLAKELDPPCDRIGKRALIVEDNEINQTILRQFLEDIKLDVVSAANGKSGLIAAHDTKFDYIFMDVSMPVLDGISATRALKNDPKGASYDATIIGFTAHSSSKSRRECLTAGMSEVLVKPVTRESISNAIGCTPPASLLPAEKKGGLIDLGQVAAIRAILGPKQFAQTCRRFKTELRKEFEQLQQNIKAAPNGQSLSIHIDQIHKIAGLCASLGAAKLHMRLEAAHLFAEDNAVPALTSELEKAAIDLEATINSQAYSAQTTLPKTKKSRPVKEEQD